MSNTDTTTAPATDKISNAKAKFAKGAKPKKAAKAPKKAKASKAKKEPRGPVPNGTGETMKFQANGPTGWKKSFQAIAGKDGAIGEGVRACLAYGLEHQDAVKSHAAKLAKAAAKE